ncbi:hypothetical protein [Hymenobacter sp. B81]|uniref:hypothetical protein n=1 Tax=Hymenobacter sp. B81 TaxID=3344878 RepID=UPI0037DD2F7E
MALGNEKWYARLLWLIVTLQCAVIVKNFILYTPLPSSEDTYIVIHNNTSEDIILFGIPQNDTIATKYFRQSSTWLLLHRLPAGLETQLRVQGRTVRYFCLYASDKAAKSGALSSDKCHLKEEVTQSERKAMATLLKEIATYSCLTILAWLFVLLHVIFRKRLPISTSSWIAIAVLFMMACLKSTSLLNNLDYLFTALRHFY